MARQNSTPPDDNRTGLYGLEGPLQDDQALVVDIGGPEAVRAAVNGFKSGAPEVNAISGIIRYVDQHDDAALKPLCPEPDQEILGDGRWRLSVPRPDREFSGLHYLRLADSKHVVDWERALLGGPEINYAHRPTIFRPLNEPQYRPPGSVGQWGLDRCEFPQVWTCLEQGDDPGPIAVLDAGGHHDHPEIKDRIEDFIISTQGPPSRSAHALAVAGVIAAEREKPTPNSMRGCCSAKVRMYNVWTQSHLDSEAFYCGLKDAADSGARVVNLSMESRTSDETTVRMLRRCMERGVVVVAAMGNNGRIGSPPVFPAAHCEVIAVGATNRADRKTAISSSGCHIWISAPGEGILTPYGIGDYTEDHGTSYATAMVSAAVWLALHADKSLTPADIRQILAQSTNGDGSHNPEVGYGRLDMRKLAELVKPGCLSGT